MNRRLRASGATPRVPENPTFGYRLKVPLALMAVALVSGILVAATTYALVDRHVEANAEAETRRLASTLARALVQPMLRNDIWQAFQTMRAATPPQEGPSPGQVAQVVALDARGQVFASPSPRVHPLGLHLSALPDPLARAARAVFEQTPPAPARVSMRDTGMLVLAAPIVGDEDALLGVVLASHPRALTDAQRATVIRQLLVLGAGAMLVVALAGAAIGLRMTAPLARLRAVMQAAPHRGAGDGGAMRHELDDVCQRRDEVGELGRSFAAMLDQIDAQQELERHMLEAERMASIGQLTAGIAHEVNNPLGGMLAAIENRRLRGGLDDSTARTLALLERGLRQVHETVQALLNEARSERHPLTDADLRDLELLLRPEAEQVRCGLAWNVSPPLQDLPAVPVRQVMLNLTLNAIAAAGRGGDVRVWTRSNATTWEVWVGNSGPPLDATKLAALTQGSERSAGGRLGLGLWITARILHTSGGALRLDVPPSGLATVLVAAFVLPAEPSLAGLAASTEKPNQP
jgi:signal transduction histidine kinase